MVVIKWVLGAQRPPTFSRIDSEVNLPRLRIMRKMKERKGKRKRGDVLPPQQLRLKL